MHTEVRQFIKRVKALHPDNFRDCRVLEVGSRDVNGTVREHFTNCDYTGIDLTEGKGVDVAKHMLEFIFDCGLEVYDTVISTETLEHDAQYRYALQAMFNALKPGGLLIVTAAGINREPHGTHESHPEDSPATLDWYRNISERDFETFIHNNALHAAGLAIEHARDEQDIYFYGVKPNEA